MSEQLPPELTGWFEGIVDLSLNTPTPEGRSKFRLNSDVIDGDAEAFFGRGFCHWLAGAVHCLTGWDLITYDRQQPDGSWLPAHTAIVAPSGRILDIFGEHEPEAVVRRYEPGPDNTLNVVRTRRVRNEDMCGEVVRGADHLRGDPLWWSKNVFTGDLTAVITHFARVLVTKHNYREHLPENRANRSADAVIPAARPAPETRTASTTPSSGGTTAMSIDTIRETMASSNEKAQFACGALRQAHIEFSEIVSTLSSVGAGESSQEGPRQALATYSQLRDQLDEFQIQVSQAIGSVEQYAHQL
ncbi:hypothetical protein [Saccharopolyspora sp. NPDC002686]|uniref:hypothetical protein n=1 Tax=Saccharopolyspora sp. NPDC002686 TaxID=3154541 RepID=UPI00332BCAAC